MSATKGDLRVLAWLLGLALAITIPYKDNPFYRDDENTILNNPEVRRVLPLTRHFLDPTTYTVEKDFHAVYRPLVPLSWSLSHALHGEGPAGFRLDNAVLHGLAAYLLFLLCLRLLPEEEWRWTAALGVATLFAAHPVSTFAHQYVTGRDLVQANLFFLASLLHYQRHRGRAGTWGEWAVTLGLYTCALLSKKNAVAAAGVIFFQEWILARRPLSDRGVWKACLAFGLVGAAVFVLPQLLLQVSGLGHAYREGIVPIYAAAQLEVHVFHYLANFVWPLPIRWEPFVAEQPLLRAGTVAGGLVLLALIGQALRGRREHPVASFGLLAYLCLLFPTSSVAPLAALAIHYRPYPGSPFLFLALGAALAPRLSRGRGRWVAGGLLLGLLAGSLHVGHTGRDMRANLEHRIHHGSSPRSELMYVLTLPDVEDQLEQTRDIVARYPRLGLAHEALAKLMLLRGDREEAVRHLHIADQLARGQGEHGYWLALLEELDGRRPRGSALTAGAARPRPAQLRWFGFHAMEGGRLHLAARVLEDAVTLADWYQDAWYWLGRCRLLLGENEGAAAALRKALATGEPAPEIRRGLVQALQLLGRCGGAEPHLSSLEAAGDPAAPALRARCPATP